MPTMLDGYFRARQAQANLDQTEVETERLRIQTQADQATAQRQGQLSQAVRQVFGGQPPEAGYAPPPEQVSAMRPGDIRAPIDPSAGDALARAAGLPHNLAVTESSLGRSRMESQADKLRALGDLHIMFGESNIGRQFLDSAGRAEKTAGELEEKELNIQNKQVDAMGSLAASVHDQKSLDRALLAGMARGYDVSELMEASGGGQWNEDTAAALSQYSRTAMSVKEQNDLDLNILREERQAESTASLIQQRRVSQSIARSRLSLAREGFALKKAGGGRAGGRRIGGFTVNELKGMFKLENDIKDPVEMYSLKKNNPAAYEAEIERMKGIEGNFPKWVKDNTGEELFPSKGTSGAKTDYQPIIDAAAQEHGIPANIIESVMQTESAGDPNAVSPKGAGGLMQIMPGTAAELGITNEERFDPEKAIPAGAQYLRKMYDQFGSWDKALAAYNAGPGRVASGKPLPEETKAYVPKVLKGAGEAPKGGLSPAVLQGLMAKYPGRTEEEIRAAYAKLK